MRYASLPLEQLSAWAAWNNVELHGARVCSSITDDQGNDKGGGLQATRLCQSGETLLTIPGDLVLSREGVQQSAKTDQRLRELLEATSTFNLKPRLMILVFLLYQITNSSLDAQPTSATSSPLTDYVKFLPKDILLPTFYTSEERELLVGTSLADALEQKLASLEKEFKQLKAATESIGWCQKLWWDEDSGILGFEDWKLADAMYRSRALELPNGIGDAMVPVVDMANHSYAYNARFEVDAQGNTLLLVRENHSIAEQEEISIIYGCGGACEMIFSYGFLDDSATCAREIFASLNIDPEDPLRIAKISYSQEAPGARLFVNESGELLWESDYVWWACVNEEDGLDFTVVQTNDGEKKLKALWKGKEFQAHELKSLLMGDKLRDVFVLRATMLILQRVEKQGMELAGSEDHFDQARYSTNVRASTWKMISRLRELELKMITDAFETLETQKARLLETDKVRDYLGSNPGPGASSEVEEDFS